jgi:formyltetrahydrofolate-dependent phosphoribosylglycinamide formyltransferase
MQNLAEVIARRELDAEIVCCIASNSRCYGIERARKLGIPVAIIPRKEFAGVEDFSAKIAQTLREYRVDLALMAGFLSLWTIPEDYWGKVMNIHPALLPKYGGQGMHGERVHAAVLAAGETESGCTVHFADNAYDRGPIILQRRVPVMAGDTVETLAKRVFEQECIAYPEAVRRFGEGNLDGKGATPAGMTG